MWHRPEWLKHRPEWVKKLLSKPDENKSLSKPDENKSLSKPDDCTDLKNKKKIDDLVIKLSNSTLKCEFPLTVKLLKDANYTLDEISKVLIYISDYKIEHDYILYDINILSTHFNVNDVLKLYNIKNANDIFQSDLAKKSNPDDIFNLYEIKKDDNFWNLSEESLNYLYLIMNKSTDLIIDKDKPISITYNTINILKYIDILKLSYKQQYKSNEDLLKTLILQKYIPVSFSDDKDDLNKYSTVSDYINYIKIICQKVFDKDFDDKELILILIQTTYAIFHEDVYKIVEREKLTIKLPLSVVKIFDNTNEELKLFIKANRNSNRQYADIKHIFTQNAWQHISTNILI
jgi:hypothetical protein